MDRQRIKDIAYAYLYRKSQWSYFNDMLMFWAPRAPLMNFYTVSDAAQYVLGRYSYKNDPVGGLLDHHIHPMRLQAQLQHGHVAVPWQSFDCDKVAAWMYATVRNHPTVEQCKLVTIICAMNPDPTQFFNQSNWGHHTLCLIKFHGGHSVVLDTNGYNSVPNISEEVICERWSRIYESLGYRYLAYLDVPFPW